MDDPAAPPTRRQFMGLAAPVPPAARKAAAGSVAGVGAVPGQAQAQAQLLADERSLVCVYLAGGNDQSNTVVPTGAAEYAAYARARGALALPKAQLLALAPTGWTGQALALHPALAPLMPLFNGGQLGIVANVGTLAYPISRSEWNGGVPLKDVPRQLFSHSDQQGAWQSGLPDRPSNTGWLGRMGDVLVPSAGSSPVSMAMSVAGNTLLLAGESTVQYQLTVNGAVKVRALDGLFSGAEGGAALQRLITETRAHLLENELNRVTRRAIACESTVAHALATGTVVTPFPATRLGSQLRMVARMIGARRALGQRRQVFYVQAGGYDFHDNLLIEHASRMSELADALAAFHAATVELGLAGSVTTFTASDFGRALQSNGRGADHGWGSHHFVMGGSVHGKRVHGAFPQVQLGGPEDAGQGRLIPSLSVDQYAAPFVRWMGVADSDMSTVLPNRGRFDMTGFDFLNS